MDEFVHRRGDVVTRRSNRHPQRAEHEARVARPPPILCDGAEEGRVRRVEPRSAELPARDSDEPMVASVRIPTRRRQVDPRRQTAAEAGISVPPQHRAWCL